MPMRSAICSQVRMLLSNRQQPFQVQIFYGGGSHVFAENAGQIGMADMEVVRQLAD